MDYELFQLCQKVYMLTSWSKTKESYELDSDEEDWFESDSEHDLNDEDMIPLYTSDYLLEKLQEKYDIVLSNDERMWRAMNKRAQTLCDADTPLKALLKLAVAMDEAGEL